MMGRKQKMKRGGLLAVLLLLFCAWFPYQSAKAEDVSLQIVEIDYEKETMTVVSASQQDTKLFYSDGKQKNWECAYGQFGPAVVMVNGSAVTYPKAYVLDISWVSKSKNYTMSLKGDVSEKVIQVVLPKQQTNFKAVYDYTKEIFDYTNQEGRDVYWRKNNSTTWSLVDGSMQSTIKRFYARGAAMYFRLGQVKGTNEQNPGMRPSKEVKLSVSKQAAAPSVTIAASTKTLNLGGLLQYIKDPTVQGATWQTASSKKLEIKDIAPEAYYTDGTSDAQGAQSTGATPSRDVAFVFRTAATAKKPASMEKEITIKAQEGAPGNVSIKVASPTSLSLQVEEVKDGDGNVVWQAASTSNPYEYAILTDPNAEPTSSTAWTSLTKSGAVSISSEKAPEGSKIYVRKQAHVEDKTSFCPESRWSYYVVGKYRQASSVALVNDSAETASAYKDSVDGKTVIRLVKEEGVGNSAASGDGTSTESPLTFKVLPGEQEAGAGSGAVNGTTDIEVTSIECGGVDLKFSAAKDANGAIVVSITSTEDYEAKVAVRNEHANIIITLSNGEVLNDSVTLKVLGGAYVLQETLVKVIQGAENSTAYEFVVVPGYRMTAVKDQYEKTSITSFTIKDQTISASMKPAIPNGNYEENSDGNYKVCLTQAELASFIAGAALDEKYKAVIHMSNGQDVTAGLEFCVTTEATMVDGAKAYFLSLSETFAQTVEFRIAYKTPNISIRGIVLTNGTEAVDVMGGGSYVDKDYIHVVISNQKINAYQNWKVSDVYRVVVTLTNGVKVETGFTVQVIN